MQLYALDATSFQPTKLIENYDSLIWTERYRPCGDFVLETPNIASGLTDLPLGSLVGIGESLELSFVETHSIAENEDGERVLKIAGRTFESFFENRTTLSPTPSATNSPITNPTTGENNSQIITGSSAAAATILMSPSSVLLMDSRDDIRPIYVCTNQTTKTLTSSTRFIDRGEVYAIVLEILKEDELGVCNIRPINGATKIVSHVYNGTDKSASVIFDVGCGHFRSVNYLWSIIDYKNAVYVASQKGFRSLTASGASGFNSLARRVGSLELPDITQTTNISAILGSKGTSYLNQNKKTVLMEGSVSPNIPYEYGVDYNLGDTILCRGDYGVSQKMMVTEYVRIEDENGEQGYPTLAVI